MMFILILLILVVLYVYNKKSKETFIANSITQPPFESWTEVDCTLDQNCSIDNNTPDNVKFLLGNFTKCREQAFIDPCDSPNFRRLNAAFCFPEFNNDPCKDTQYLNSPQGKEFCCTTKHEYDYDIPYDSEGKPIKTLSKTTNYMLSFDYSKKFMKDNFNTCTSLGFNPCRDKHNYNRKISTYPRVPQIPDWRDNFPAALRSEFKEFPSGMNVCGTTVQYTNLPTQQELAQQEAWRQAESDRISQAKLELQELIRKEYEDSKYSYYGGQPG